MATKRTLIGNIKGPKGDTGAQGPQGATGPGATIEVGTVSTTAYGNTAQVTNSGTATAAVLDFVIPQGKPGEQTTKMSGLTLDTVTASTAKYPIPATGDTGSVAWGKVIKFFNDAKTAISSKINISDIVNNLTSTATNKPLSAAQGKALNDAIQNYVALAPSEWTGSWDNTYTTPLTAYRLIMLTAEYNGQIMAQQMYPPSMLADKNVYLAYQDPTWNGRVKFTFNSAMTKCTVSQFNNFSKVKLYGIK